MMIIENNNFTIVYITAGAAGLGGTVYVAGSGDLYMRYCDFYICRSYLPVSCVCSLTTGDIVITECSFRNSLSYNDNGTGCGLYASRFRTLIMEGGQFYYHTQVWIFVYMVDNDIVLGRGEWCRWCFSACGGC
jgi:hypothetical protein